MREKKWVLNIYQPDDEAAIVKRLEKLAAKGWFLERADNWGWTLRRGEPAQVRYAVTYFPGASVFDPGPTEDQETYADYCRAAGWEFVSSYGPVQYFRSDLPDPVPIETDQGEKLSAIHRAMTKTTLLVYGLALVCALLLLAEQMQTLRQTPFSVLSSNGELVFLAVFFVMGLCAVIVPADYLIWYFRSKQSVEDGGACLPGHTWLRYVTNITLLLCLAVLLGVVLAVAGSVRRGLLVLALLILRFLPYAALWTVFHLLRRRGRDRASVRKGYIIAAVIAWIGIMALDIAFLDSDILAAPGRQPDQIYVDSHGDSHNLYADDLPVTLEDLGIEVKTADRCSYRAWNSTSILVSYSTYDQSAEGEESDLPWLRYGDQLVHFRQWGWELTDERVEILREALSGQ